MCRNVRYHTSHLLRDQWRVFGDPLRPFFLPVYAPELNLIERLWRYLKGHLACHRWWNDLAHLPQATETLLAGPEIHFLPCQSCH
jgi:transposase